MARELSKTKIFMLKPIQHKKMFFLQIYLRTWKGIDLWFLEFWMNLLGF